MLDKFFCLVPIIGLSIYWSCRSSLPITGRVTDGENPIQDAVVRWQATTVMDTTDANGIFTLPNVAKSNASKITAWKNGYYIWRS